MKTPFLILSDSPTAKTGLGRITRDISTRMHAHMQDVVEVGTCGCGGPPSRKLGFPQYSIDMEEFVVNNLPEIWEDFAYNQKGYLMSVWDASRLQWLGRPEMCDDRRLKDFLNKKLFKRWGYFPQDATGVGDKLTAVVNNIMDGFDRTLAYSKWSEDIFRRGMTKTEGIENLPHGIESNVFYPRNRVQARHGFGQKLGARWNIGKKTGQFISIPDDALLIGVVATNQARKDWGLAFAILAELRQKRNIRAWLHTDNISRCWSFDRLCQDFNLREPLIVTAHEPTDEVMAWSYSACDLTLGIGLGEGFGFPIFESLACGTPCFHGNYAGAPEHMPKEMLIDPTLYRLDGIFNCIRPVYDVDAWVKKIDCWLDTRPHKVALPEHLDWNNLWPRWEAWLRKGLNEAANPVSA
jgi:glycosyltransferase involved in cell wall biosynthesis